MPIIRFFASVLAAALVALALVAPAAGQDNPSGLKLPRFVSTRSEPINVRVGPGIKYDIAWVFKIAGLPVEITQEFDVWRKIRYVDGAEGWIHQNLLSSRRTALVRAADGADRVALRTRAADDALVRAWLGDGFLVDVESCHNAWCAVSVEKTAAAPAMTGYVAQSGLWGVYPDETFD